MKTARFVLKLVALGLTVASAVCLVIAYWDKIASGICALSAKIEGKMEARQCCPAPSAEFEDYADCEL